MFHPIHALVLAVSLLAIAVGWQNLSRATAGLVVTRTTLGVTPVTVFRPASSAAAPVVVIAHGFAGSQQFMQPFATTLARNGYIAVTFDFLGHGRHPLPLQGSIIEADGATQALLSQFGEIVAFARALSSSDKGLATLGHSMASDIVVRYAATDPAVKATVAVSLFSPVVTARSPRNLLVIVGALEPDDLKDEGLRVVGMVSGAPPRERVTYGSFQDGTARRAAFAAGVEHVSVLYSGDGLGEAVAWLNAVFGREPSGPEQTLFIDTRGPWLALLFLGLILLAWPLSRLLPEVSAEPRGAGLPWRTLLPVALAPALLTPLILWKLPTDFLPILVGDYLAAHFALYGVLTAAGLWIVRCGTPAGPKTPLMIGKLAIAAGAVALYSIVALGQPIDLFVASFTPVPQRIPLIFAMLAGTLPYFIADEWLTRGPSRRPGAYAATKLFFLMSLALAVALNLEKLFFLIIIVPVILIFFIVYGLFSGWAYRRTHHPLVGALANAMALAWAIAVTFPVLNR